MLSKMRHTKELRLNLPPFLGELVLKATLTRTFLLLIITPVGLRSTLRGGERARAPCAPARDEVSCTPSYEWISNIFLDRNKP